MKSLTATLSASLLTLMTITTTNANAVSSVDQNLAKTSISNLWSTPTKTATASTIVSKGTASKGTASKVSSTSTPKAAVKASKAQFKSMLLSPDQWQQVRDNPASYQSLLKGCERNLGYKASPVKVLDVVSHYNSTGVNTTGNEGAKRLSADAWVSYRGALCYQITKDPKYARHSQSIIDAWAKTLKEVRGEQARADVNFNFPAMVMASYWVRNVNNWDQSAWQQLLRNKIKSQSTAYTANNNHGNWGVLLDTTIAVYLKDSEMLNKAYMRWQNLLINEVTPTGVYKNEICRSDTSNWCGGPTKGIKGMAYTHYAMQPTTVAAQIFAQNGIKFWQGTAGERLGKAYHRTALWANNPQKFPYYQSNKGKLQSVRNGAYFVVLQRYFASSEGNKAISQGDLQGDGFQLKILFPTQ